MNSIHKANIGESSLKILNFYDSVNANNDLKGIHTHDGNFISENSGKLVSMKSSLLLSKAVDGVRSRANCRISSSKCTSPINSQNLLKSQNEDEKPNRKPKKIKR